MCKPIRHSIAAEHGGREVAANGRRYGGCGRGGRPMAAPTACAAGGAGRGRQGAVPTGGRVPALSLRGPVRPVAIRNPVPFSNVFKWQFENTTILNFQFSILNFQFAQAGGNGGQ